MLHIMAIRKTVIYLLSELSTTHMALSHNWAVHPAVHPFLPCRYIRCHKIRIFLL